jgi:peptide deformylase
MEKERKLLDIYKYGDDILNLKATEVKNIDEQFIKLKQQMIDTMHNSHSAIGLAAPQVGRSIRLSVIDTSRGENKDDLLVLINPEILEAEGSDIDNEGCLSFPGINVPIKRNTRIFLKSIDTNGKEIKREIEGYLARVILHEIDHLNGMLIIDRLSSLKRQMLKKEIKRLKKNGAW